VHPLIEIGRSKSKEEALAGVERWRLRHPEAAAHLAPADVLVDAMRGRYTTWTRIRINLQHVPDNLRPIQEPLDPDESLDSAAGYAAKDTPPGTRQEGRTTKSPRPRKQVLPPEGGSHK
jgi:hypothetical protein